MSTTDFPKNDIKEDDVELVFVNDEEDSVETESSSTSAEKETGKKNRPPRTKQDIIRYIVMFVSLAVFIFSACMLIYYISGYIKARNIYKDIDNNVRETSDATVEYVDDESKEYNFEIGNTIDFESLKEINEDTVGWISIPSVGIEYPVVKGTDNDYYLKHGHNKVEMWAGAIFMNYNCSSDWSDTHTIVYGHHMQDGSMFSKLLKYDEESFYQKHDGENYIYIYTEENIRVYEIFAIVDAESAAAPIPFSLNIPGRYSMSEFSEAIRDAALYDTGFETLSDDDKVITLMTCQTNSQSNVRHLVHGKLITIVEYEK